jgi:16S rRNA (guanine966-N2)-methyltransferase
VRIIAGTAKGRRLVSPRGGATRPLTDRVREALFSSLGADVIGARVLDLYAGSGSVGLEALSRGAASVVFVERDRRALTALRTNVAAVGLGGEVVADDVERYVTRLADSIDVAFVDPPYALPLASILTVLERMEPSVTDGGTVVVHRRKGEEPPQHVAGLTLVDRRRYGDAAVWRYRKGAS